MRAIPADLTSEIAFQGTQVLTQLAGPAPHLLMGMRPLS